MKNHTFELVMIGLVGIALGMFITLSIMGWKQTGRVQAMRDRAVQWGLGHYDERTADWKWNSNIPGLKYTITGSGRIPMTRIPMQKGK